MVYFVGVLDCLHFPGFRDACRSRCSLLLNGKFLDTVVKGVHDKEVAVTVEGQPVRGKELTRLGPFRSEAAQVLALGGEPLDATAYRADPDPVVLVDTESNRPLEGRLAACEAAERAAEAARLDLIVPPGQQELALRRELLHPALRAFRGVEVPLAVEGQELRSAYPRPDRDLPTELARFAPVLTPLEQEPPIAIEHLDTAVGLVRDVNPTIVSHSKATRAVELAVVAAGPAPLP